MKYKTDKFINADLCIVKLRQAYAQRLEKVTSN